MKLLTVALLFVAQLSAALASGCFNSTKAFLLAQATDNRSLSEHVTYKFCDDIVINIGVPANALYTDFLFGDFPLALLFPNMTVECNNCTLRGGLIQMVSVPQFLVNGTILVNGNTNNVIVRGFTFTGTFFDARPTLGTSILLSAAGKNMVFEDLTFKDLTGEAFMVAVGPTTVNPTGTPKNSVEMTLRNSSFTNINRASALVACDGQKCNVDGIRVDGVKKALWTILGTDGGTLSVTNSCFDNIAFNESTTFARSVLGMFTSINATDSSVNFAKLENLYFGPSITEFNPCDEADDLYENTNATDGLFFCRDSTWSVSRCPLDPPKACKKRCRPFQILCKARNFIRCRLHGK